MMGAARALCLGLAVLAVASCASAPPFIEAAQPEAIQTAQRRAQFEWNCAAATAQVVSQQMMPPSVQQYTRFAPPDRAEYTVGVSGCGQRQTILVVCSDGYSGCLAVAGRPN